MIAALADTHAALWFLFGDTRRKIVLAPIRLAEVLYLVEKNRLAASASDDLTKAITV